jgi:hypothetical protein
VLQPLKFPALQPLAKLEAQAIRLIRLPTTVVASHVFVQMIELYKTLGQWFNATLPKSYLVKVVQSQGQT